MPKHQPRPKQPDQHLHHLMTMQPRALISHQPALRRRILVILANVVLVRREHERAVARQVDLHEAEARRVARAVAEGDALAELEGRCGEGLPVEGGEGEVGGEVDAAVSFGGDGPGGVFEFFFVDVDCGGEGGAVNFGGSCWGMECEMGMGSYWGCLCRGSAPVRRRGRGGGGPL